MAQLALLIVRSAFLVPLFLDGARSFSHVDASPPTAASASLASATTASPAFPHEPSAPLPHEFSHAGQRSELLCAVAHASRRFRIAGLSRGLQPRLSRLTGERERDVQRDAGQGGLSFSWPRRTHSFI